MRRISLALLLIVLSVPVFAQQEYGRELFNFAWKFHHGELPDAFKPAFNDKDWRLLDVPHDFSIEGSFNKDLPSCNSYLPGGIGWYRKSFTAPLKEKGKKVFIHFDGVYKNSEVWINGHYLGKRPSGYIAFEYDLTPWIIFGKENVIAVKADHTDLTDSGWYTGSGIYRNVYLLYKHPVHIKQWGTFVRTPSVSHAQALVNTSIALQNETEKTRSVVVETSLLDAAGNNIARTTANGSISGKGETTFELSLTVPKPQLWSVDTPYLYTLRTTIRSGGKVIDQQDIKTGIRELRFDSEKGFFLNGKNMKLKGVCMVHDAGVLGSAVPRAVWESRLHTLKELGCNAIRACHNPHSAEFLDVCDEQGFLVIAEAFDEWDHPKTKWIDGWNQTKKVKNGYAQYFPQWGETDLRDEVLRDRNHPSVIMWSIGNEIDFPNDPYTHPSLDSFANPQTFARYTPGNPDAARLKDLAQKLTTVVKSVDTTRPVTSGLASAYMSTQVGYAGALDVVGYNYQESLYPANHKKYPGQILYGSETGHRFEYWKAVTDNDFVIGQFLWTGFEYMGESFKWPQRLNPFGIIDLGGFFKPEAYFRQSLWSEKPMAYIGAWDTTVTEPTIYYLWDHHNALPHWNWTAGKTIKIRGFTNCEEMELFLNGKSLGKKKMADFADHVITWLVPYEKGTLKARAGSGGKVLAEYELNTAGAATQLRAERDKPYLKADRQDVTSISVYVDDQHNVPVYLAENNITIHTAGPVKLLGIENSNPTDTSDYKGNHHHAFRGKLKVYIQALDKPGKAVVTISSPGLKDAVVDLMIKQK
ncbi:sugar-binding domain-containing protein [Chitinophaga sp. MM2321]|uniref:sugar-binding domain-containing protein n=1 Tax=Chitinophaga sp. MM2321 TaxID=3137178 RepID=UPI0032D5B136